MNKAYSIGIIGGADGPTAIFLTGRFPWEIIIAAALIVAAVVWLIKRKK